MAPDHGQLTTDKALFGDHKAVVRPDPIPNSAVKHSLADGSGSIGSARVGCRQIFPKRRSEQFGTAFIFRGKADIPAHPVEPAASTYFPELSPIGFAAHPASPFVDVLGV